MERAINMVGKTVGLWKVLERDSTKPKRAYWVCTCLGCGDTASISGTHLRENIKGGCRSCRSAGAASKHPHEYKIWQNIKTRAFNPNRSGSKKYNSIGMYKPWVNDFMAFFHAVGPRPSLKHSIDRIDNEKGYFPGNVRWATAKEQARNTSRNILVNGKILLDLAKELNIPYNTLRDRYHKYGLHKIPTPL